MDHVSTDICPWICGGPSDPSTPFEGPVFMIVDIFRILIALSALLLLVASIWAIRRATTSGQKCRFLYVITTSIIIAGAEVEHLGDWPNWRFLVSIVAVAIGAYGTFQHLFRELPARDRVT